MPLIPSFGNWRSVILLFAPLFLFSGCSRSTVSTSFQSSEFSILDLRTAPSLLIVNPEVRVQAFAKAYRALTKDSTALSVRISRKIVDSAKFQSPMIVELGLPDSALKQRLAETGAKYVVSVTSLTIQDTSQEMDDVLLPGIGGMQPSRGGTSKSCIIDLEVNILDSNLVKRYEFKAHSKTNVLLYAYKTAVLNGLDAAAGKIALHLQGPNPDSAIYRPLPLRSLPFYKNKSE